MKYLAQKKPWGARVRGDCAQGRTTEFVPPPRGVSSGSDGFLGLRPPAAQGSYSWSRVPWAWWAPAPRSAQAEAGCPCHPAVGSGHWGMDTEALGSELGSCGLASDRGGWAGSPSSRSPFLISEHLALLLLE